MPPLRRGWVLFYLAPILPALGILVTPDPRYSGDPHPLYLHEWMQLITFWWLAAIVVVTPVRFALRSGKRPRDEPRGFDPVLQTDRPLGRDD